MLLAVMLFSAMDTIIKALSAHYPPLQIAAMRGALTLPLIALWIQWRGSWAAVWQARWPLHLLRGGLVIAMLVLFTYGVRGLPLTHAYTLMFFAPLLITVLAWPVLGERVPRAHWWAVGGGLLGVLVALRPSAEGFASWSGLAVLGAAVCYAVSAVVTRLSSRTDSKDSLVLWVMVILTVVAGALALPQWLPLQAHHLPLWAGLAASGFLAQLAITEAFRHGQASAVAPFEYTALAWSLGIDWLVWQQLPDAFTLLGGAIIVGSGLYVLRHEQVHATAEHP
ncbi:EamA family transporter [Rhodoferax sp. TS-BS-61-7]|nr:EamA family transporter [Rhodoferax sp. TS-BS-61-7]